MNKQILLTLVGSVLVFFYIRITKAVISHYMSVGNMNDPTLLYVYTGGSFLAITVWSIFHFDTLRKHDDSKKSAY